MENNNQKLRQALESLLDFLYNIGIDEETASISHKDPALRELLHTDRTLKVLRKAKAALAEPRRNCEVGTEQEQQDRFREFCRHYESMGECGIGRSKAACPAFQGGRNPDCSLWWAHMPYKKGETK